MRIKMPLKIVLCLMLFIMLPGCSGSGGSGTDSDVSADTNINPYEITPSSIETFQSVDGDICTEDGKPVIRLFSTTWCLHCQWVSDAFDEIVKMYVDEGSIVAHHWQVDTGDDTLTSQVEESVPESEMDVYDKFNPQETVPTFVFGCKYYRIGTAYEAENDPEAEAAEFMAVIEELLSEQVSP